jgi:hypothetical protein
MDLFQCSNMIKQKKEFDLMSWGKSYSACLDSPWLLCVAFLPQLWDRTPVTKDPYVLLSGEKGQRIPLCLHFTQKWGRRSGCPSCFCSFLSCLWRHILEYCVLHTEVGMIHHISCEVKTWICQHLS